MLIKSSGERGGICHIKGISFSPYLFQPSLCSSPPFGVCLLRCEEGCSGKDRAGKQLPGTRPSLVNAAASDTHAEHWESPLQQPREGRWRGGLCYSKQRAGGGREEGGTGKRMEGLAPHLCLLMKAKGG